MKLIIALLTLFSITHCLAQITTSSQSTTIQTDTSSAIVFFEDFRDNKNNWTIANNKNESARIDSGIYYLTATAHAYGEFQEIKIDTHKDFEIEARIKIVSGNADHRGYYSMLFWGREAMNGYYFTFAKDGFASVEICDGKNQSDCITKSGSLQKTTLNPDKFNVYTIRKTGRTYLFLINGAQFYEMPFEPFFGNQIGFGAGRKISLAIDYLKVIYL